MIGTESLPSGQRGGRRLRGSDAVYGEASDVCLVVAIIRPDADALAEIYRRYCDQLYGLARRLCDPDEAEEVLQEVILDFWRRPERLDFTRVSVPTFLSTQIYGRAIDRRHRGGGTRRPAGRTTAPRSPSPRTDVIEPAVLNRLAAEKGECLLAQLPDDERHAIALASSDGHTYRTVAGLLGRPEGMVKTQIRSGLTRLRARRTGAVRMFTLLGPDCCPLSSDTARKGNGTSPAAPSWAIAAVDPGAAYGCLLTGLLG